MSVENTLQQLQKARESGKDKELHDALLAHANALLVSNQYIDAGQTLDEAVLLHRRANRILDEAHCLHLSSTAYRFAGRLHLAETRSRSAVAIAPANTPMAVSSWTEFGETALAAGKATEAMDYYKKALGHGQKAGLLPKAQLGLMRRLAQAQAVGHSSTLSAQTLRKAVTLAKQINEKDVIIRFQIEEATAWLNSPLPEQAVTALEESEQLANQTEDYAALADLEVLRSTLAVRNKDMPKAFNHAKRARELALKAVDALSYTTSAIAMSEIADLQNEKHTAYEVLAVGWATLGDLMGNDIAKNTFTPKLRELVKKWGKEEFLRVKSQYEEQRRSMRSES